MTAENLVGFDTIPQTIPHFCLRSFRIHQKSNALNFKFNEKWNAISGERAAVRVCALALGLSDLGVGTGDKIAMVSENRPEWSLVDLALLSLRAVNVPIYTTQSVDQIRYILENSGARMIVISGQKIFRHVKEALRSLDQIEKLIFLDSESVPADDKRALHLEEIERRGAEIHEADQGAFDKLLEVVQPHDLATIIYTSGTTGEPKGVMLSHEAFTSNILAISKGLPIKATDRSLAVLPLSHIFERVVFYVLCSNGVAVHYAATFEHLAAYLQEVRPTIMTAVPRLFEQVYHKIVKKGMAAGGCKTSLFVWALAVGQDYWEAKDNHSPISLSLAARHSIASRLVFSKWRAAVGGAIRFFVSGGAPLSRKLSYAFWAAGIPILQGYGMTEACVTCANRPEDAKVGSIGRPFEGIEMKVAESDGELLIRGKNVMMGYYEKPGETAAVLDGEGWYHTGDVGYQDKEGHFHITDRLKDLFKLSNGKYVAPQQVESLLKQSPLVAQAVVVGSGRKQVGALIVPDWATLRQTLKDEGIVVEGKNEELAASLRVIKRVQRDAVDLTRELSDYERVKRVSVLAREFSIDKGEMTPTLKIKRNVIDEKYEDTINEICGG
jgi:long-chain acyl-CoA synthetase